jgi:hypothetical protein
VSLVGFDETFRLYPKFEERICQNIRFDPTTTKKRWLYLQNLGPIGLTLGPIRPTLGPISGPLAEVDLQLHPFIIHPSAPKLRRSKTDAFFIYFIFYISYISFKIHTPTGFLLLNSCILRLQSSFTSITNDATVQ